MVWHGALAQSPASAPVGDTVRPGTPMRARLGAGGVSGVDVVESLLQAAASGSSRRRGRRRVYGGHSVRCEPDMGSSWADVEEQKSSPYAVET
jgi:hypothetical protein